VVGHKSQPRSTRGARRRLAVGARCRTRGVRSARARVRPSLDGSARPPRSAVASVTLPLRSPGVLSSPRVPHLPGAARSLCLHSPHLGRHDILLVPRKNLESPFDGARLGTRQVPATKSRWRRLLCCLCTVSWRFARAPCNSADGAGTGQSRGLPLFPRFGGVTVLRTVLRIRSNLIGGPTETPTEAPRRPVLGRAATRDE
jgi:hypothetical protein